MKRKIVNAMKDWLKWMSIASACYAWTWAIITVIVLRKQKKEEGR